MTATEPTQKVKNFNETLTLVAIYMTYQGDSKN